MFVYLYPTIEHNLKRLYNDNQLENAKCKIDKSSLYFSELNLLSNQVMLESIVCKLNIPSHWCHFSIDSQTSAVDPGKREFVQFCHHSQSRRKNCQCHPFEAFLHEPTSILPYIHITLPSSHLAFNTGGSTYLQGNHPYASSTQT